MWKEINYKLISYDDIIEAIKTDGIDAVYEKLLDLFYTEPFIVVGDSMKYSPWDEEELYRFLEITYTTYKEE